MKIQYVLMGILITSVAHSAEFGVYANSVSAYNIAVAQRAIANRVFAPVTTTVKATTETTTTKPLVESPEPEDPDAYGEMIYYGEFGDDTGVLPLITGRNGGDTDDEYFRIGWQHFSDNVKFKSYSHLKSTSDLAFAAYGNIVNSGNMELFGGYSGAHTKNSLLDMDTNGAFVGVSYAKKVYDFELAAMADFGFAQNDVTSAIYSDDFNNFYAGIMANLAYEYDFDQGAAFRPELRAGYTWVNSASYISNTGSNVSGDDFGFFEITPMLSLIGDAGDGLAIGAYADYVMHFVIGGEQQVDYVTVPKLDTNNYFEYGITVAQNFDGFSLNVNLGRHDGARSGWNGGAEFKYVF